MSGSQQPLLGYGTSAYRIANSLRFRSSASAYLNRTPSTASNQQTWTWSGWVKRGKLGAEQAIFVKRVGTATAFFRLIFQSNDTLQVWDRNSSSVTTLQLDTSAVYRDASAWYHIVLAVDTTQASSTNRAKLYVNGVGITAFSTATYPSQNTSLGVNSADVHTIGVELANSTYLDGYLADINFIDGQALTPSSFGAFNATTGVWGPISYTGTYGTNGFHLNFSNGTSTITLGYDSSGNGNNWTTNNISLTAGSTYDWMIDSPTPYAGSSYGVGNYAVLNPLDNGGLTVDSANLNSSDSAGSYKSIRSTIGISSGKWYWEITATSGTTFVCGVSKATASQSAGNYVGVDSSGWGYAGNNGQKYTSGSGSAYGATYTNGDVVGIAFDADAGTLTFYKNNASQGTAFTGLTSGPYFPAVSNYSSGWAINFGQRPFAYTPPSGYKSLCTYNLPTPTIQNGAGYMAATLWTGTGSSQNISNAVNGISYAPDFVWIKSRSGAGYNHILFDTIRGATKYLSSNTTGAETTNSGTLTAFNSNGFTVSFDAEANGNGQTFVGWQWKAGGTAVTNTAGSITSSVSANTTSGFSVVTYTGTGANATVGHGLGVAPSMMIVKARTGGSTGWIVYHVNMAANPAQGYLYLQATNAYAALSNVWNDTAPTSSVLSVGPNASTNASTINYVAYCFAAIPGYSAFGSYTGNGSADGPFVYCGFRPRWILIKNASTSVDNWVTEDSSRDLYNPEQTILIPNTSGAETANAVFNVDFLSNGFKLRGTSTSFNGSGNTMIYACFAENPFTNALAR